MKPPRQSKFNTKKSERYDMSSNIEIVACKGVLKEKKYIYNYFKW